MISKNDVSFENGRYICYLTAKDEDEAETLSIQALIPARRYSLTGEVTYCDKTIKVDTESLDATIRVANLILNSITH